MAVQWPPKRPLTFRGDTSLREFDVDQGATIIALFQGSRGQRPDLDAIVKYQQSGKRLRTPKHLHWAVDLLLKREHEPELTGAFIDYLLEVYERVSPYSSTEDRALRPITSTTPQAMERYGPLNAYGEYSVEFTLHIVEVMAATEKTGDPNAYMFKDVLSRCRSGSDIFAIVSAAGFVGR